MAWILGTIHKLDLRPIPQARCWLGEHCIAQQLQTDMLWTAAMLWTVALSATIVRAVRSHAAGHWQRLEPDFWMGQCFPGHLDQGACWTRAQT